MVINLRTTCEYHTQAHVGTRVALLEKHRKDSQKVCQVALKQSGETTYIYCSLPAVCEHVHFIMHFLSKKKYPD